MFRAFRARAKVPSSKDLRSVGEMKVPSVVGRNWWIWMVLAAFRRVLAGVERRREIFSLADKERGMFNAERSWLNCIWVSWGCLG